MFIIPFDSDTLKKIITGEIDSPKIDYTNSKIKGKNFITYFSNLRYKNININFDEVDVEEKKQLLLEYFKHQSTVHIEQFEAAMIKCLFYFKNYDLSLVDKSKLDNNFLNKSILSNLDIENFVKENYNTVETTIDILDGILLLAIKNLNSYKDEFGDFITSNITTEKTEIGKTFVNLLDNETFNAHYYSLLKDFDKLKYFDYYFERPIYSGQSLISFVTKEKCMIFPLLKLILDQSVTISDIKEIYKETDVTFI
jgi:hypothetical protein